MDQLIQFKKYLQKDKTKHSKVTVKNYLSDIRKFIAWFENTFHKEFAPELVSKQLAEIYKKHITSPDLQNQISAASSVKRYLSSLRKFYSYLIANRQAVSNPFEIEHAPIENETDIFHLKEFKNHLHLSHASKATRKNYIMDISQFADWLKKLPQQISLSEVNARLVEEYKTRLLYEVKFSPASVNRKLSSLRRYFSWLKKQNIINNEPEFEQIAATLSNDMAQVRLIASREADAQPEAEFSYSSFAPIRLFQKIFRFGNSAFDLLLLIPVVKILASIKYQFWKQTGRKVFTAPIDNLITQQNQVGMVRNLPKAFYAPLKISTHDMAFHEKILHHVRHSRPLWYKKYHSYRFTHYLHFGVLIVYTLFLGFTIYHALAGSSNFQSPVLASIESPPRVLSFSGKLTDINNVPITKEANLRFGLYNDQIASGSSLLWQETQVITPDQEGNFQATLGQHQSLSQRFLNDNPNLFLGITVENGKELSPRQQIATVAYSEDSERLQGMSAITDKNAGTSNVILALDSSGNLTIGGKATPRFEATGGEFTISGQTLTLTTGIDSNSNIQLAPDGTGIIDAQKPIQNTTNYGITPDTEGMVQVYDSLGIIAESSTQSALLINQNGSGNLISAMSGNTAKFTLDNVGNGSFAGDMIVNGNNLSTSSTVFSLVNKNVAYLNIGGDASSISIGASSGATMINNALAVRGTVSFSNLVNIQGDNASPSGAITHISNKNTSASANGLAIQLGNTSSTNRFISFRNAENTEISSIRGNGSNGIQIGTTTFGDWAEYFRKDPIETIPFGSLVCLKENGNATACDESENKIIGIASENPTIIAGKNQGDGSIAVGLTGLVRTLVTTENGDIKPGDMITYSSTPGIGIRASQKTMVVGRAIEGYQNNNSSEIGHILVVLQVNLFEPKTLLTQKGDIIPQEIKPQSPNLISDIIENITAGLIEANKITTHSLVITSENVTIGGKTLAEYIKSITEESVKETLLAISSQKIISPVVQTDNLQANFISPLASNSAIAIKLDNNSLTVLNSQSATSSAVAVIDNEGNARFAGNITSTDASFSGTLRAKNIIADEIEGLNDKLATLAAGTNVTNITNIYNNIATPSAEPTTLALETLNNPDMLISNFPRFEQGILALGASSLTNVAITGSLNLGQNTVFSENSINAIGANLELQALRQGNLSIMGELVTIDTEGNLYVEGNANFAKNVEVKGILAASIIAPVPESDLIIKLSGKDNSSLIIHDSTDKPVLSVNQLGDLISSGAGQFKSLTADGLNIIRGVQADTSFTETQASGSAGTAVIAAYETERTIKTPHVNERSLIYISPTSNTYGVTPYLARQGKNSFTIQIPHFVGKDILVNWWIIN